MTIDIRAEMAKYYDLWPPPFDDVPFYKQHIASPDAAVLELGCGTGRVLVPIAGSCGYIHGVDISEAMLSICKQRLAKAGVPSDKARVELNDIVGFNLNHKYGKFDLIIAPYRVFQNLETDDQVDGFFRSVRKHLTVDGSCILNVFKPLKSPDEFAKVWSSDKENFCWEKVIEGQRVVCYEKRPQMDRQKLVIYPETIYRIYEGGELKHEVVFKFAMRCYYADQFEKLIVDHGFTIVNCWGGYADEAYGQGNELVIQFTLGEKKAS